MHCTGLSRLGYALSLDGNVQCLVSVQVFVATRYMFCDPKKDAKVIFVYFHVDLLFYLYGDCYTQTWAIVFLCSFRVLPLVDGLEHVFCFHILAIIIPIDVHMSAG